jgi:hypothetical protein
LTKPFSTSVELVFQEFEEFHVALFNEYETQQKKTLVPRCMFKVSIVRFSCTAVFLINHLYFMRNLAFRQPKNVLVFGGVSPQLFADKPFSHEFKSKPSNTAKHFQERLLAPSVIWRVNQHNVRLLEEKRKCPKCKAN